MNDSETVTDRRRVYPVTDRRRRDALAFGNAVLGKSKCQVEAVQSDGASATCTGRAPQRAHVLPLHYFRLGISQVFNAKTALFSFTLVDFGRVGVPKHRATTPTNHRPHPTHWKT
jgi:hypothetical protein